jgi:hypothetical protein
MQHEKALTMKTYGHYIDGAYVDPASGEWIDSHMSAIAGPAASRLRGDAA